MFRDAYRRKYDAIRPDPSFRRALEDRMEEEMKVMRYGQGRRAARRRTIALVAALALLLAATAVAVVQGSALRQAAEDAGAAEVAERVVDVHVASDSDGFGVSIDEILWEGTQMCFSYTLRVPEDGNTYLCGIQVPRLNGERLTMRRGGAIDADMGSCSVIALGGEYGTSCTDVMELYISPTAQKLPERRFEVNAAFLRTDRPMQMVDYDTYFDMHGHRENQLFESSDVLYYFDDDPAPRFYLTDYPEVWQAQQNHYERYCVERDLSREQGRDFDFNWDEAMGLNGAELAETGIAELVRECGTGIKLDDSVISSTVFNDLEEHRFELDGASIEITDFYMSRLCVSFKGTVTWNDGRCFENGDVSRNFMILRPDGTELGQNLSHFLCSDSNETGNQYGIDGEISGFIPVEGLTEVLLAPVSQDESEDGMHYDLEDAIVLKPIFNAERARAEANATPDPTQDPAETDDLSA